MKICTGCDEEKSLDALVEDIAEAHGIEVYNTQDIV